MPYAAVNGLNMYYESHGNESGVPLVLLHGGVQTIELSFGAVLPELAKHRRVIALEAQGHGRTEDIGRELSLLANAEDVIALLDLLGIAHADLLGFSLGVLTAVELSMRYPDRVRNVVAVSAHFRSAGYHADILDSAQWSTSDKMPTEEDFHDMRDAYRALAPDPERFAEFAAATSRAPYLVDEWTVADIAGISARVLFVLGDNDFVRIDHAAELRALIPGAQLAIVPGATHSSVMRRTELIVPLVERFIQVAELPYEALED